MNEIYEKWVAAHGIIIYTPTYWYQTPAVLKLMIDRLVCADGGNPDPSSTHGKEAEEAKELEKDWDYPKHLAGRVYGLVVHGDVAGIETTRRSLSDWLDWMGLIDAGRPPCSTAMSAITNRMPKAMRPWTRTPPSRKKCATWRAAWARPCRKCARANCCRRTAS
jgi:multimeric flavodoxin WrbA